MVYGFRHLIVIISLIFMNTSYASTSLFDEFEILQPTVGPLLGKPNESSIRIWLRGPVLNALSTDQYFGAVTIKHSNSNEWSAPNLFPLKVYYDEDNFKEKKDYMGFIDLPIQPGIYDYKAGYFGTQRDLSLLTKFQWPEQSYTFRIRDPSQHNASLAFGSCRYFAKLWCWYPWLGKSDRIFESIVSKKLKTDAFAVIGDYIYGDYFNFIAQSRTYTDFMSLYEKAMNTPHFKQLLASVPCFNILDDHEVSNNFGTTYAADNPQIFRSGMTAYMCYQHMVTPGYEPSPFINHLGYPMQIGDVPAFMMNTRSNRTVNPPRIIAQEEMGLVKNWLSFHKDKEFKVLFSSVPMFPIYANNPGQDNDKWKGFPDQMMELLGHINDNEISGVVICAGDIHKSLYSQIVSPKGIEITTVIASPFFSPWGHDEGPLGELQIEKGYAEFIPGYKYVKSSQVYHMDSYARLKFGPLNKLSIKLYNSNGDWVNKNDPAGHELVLLPANNLTTD